MPNIYVVRHGQTTCNADAIIQGPRVDSTLSEEGHRQAGLLAAAFAETTVDALYVSPLTRARQTARAVTDRRPRDLAPCVVPEYYEMDYGRLCGRRVPDVQDTITDVLDAWSLGHVHLPFPGGESAVVAQHRVRPFARRLAQEAMEHDVLVVGHGRINRILVATLTSTPLSALDRFPQDNANITHLEHGREGLRIRRVNDTSHLGTAAASFS